VLRRILPVLVALCLAPAAAFAAAPAPSSDPLAAARAHLKAGKFDLVVDDLADTAKLPKGPAAQVFAEAGELALKQKDRAFAGLYCERALGLEPKEARALRTCTAVAVQEERFEQAERWGDALGALLPKDAEVALLRAQAARGRESWQMVIALLEPHQADKAVAGRLAPLLAEARKKAAAEPGQPAEAEAATSGGDADADTDAKVAAALRKARETSRGQDTQAEDSASAEKKKKWRPMGEKVVLYTVRKCGACDSVRDWLQQNEVEFEEKDADHSGQAWREAIRICGKARKVNCEVPIVVVNGEAVSGFDQGRLKTLLGL